MPCQHVVGMPYFCQPFVLINVVKSSAMNKPKKRPGLALIEKKCATQYAAPGVPKQSLIQVLPRPNVAGGLIDFPVYSYKMTR